MSVIKRRSQQIVLSSLTFSTLALVSCDSAPTIYQSVQQCEADHDDDSCGAAYQLAYLKWTEQTGYNSAEDCRLGEKISCEHRDDGTYMPPMFGFTYADSNPVTISGRNQCNHADRTDCAESGERSEGTNNAALLFLFMHNGSSTTYVRQSSPSERDNFRSYGSMSSSISSARSMYGGSMRTYSYSPSRSYGSSTTTTTGGFGGTARSFSGDGGEGGE